MDNHTILVVDDNATNLKLVSDLLEFEGYRVLTANDAEMARLIIESDPPELILLDIGLPGMDGLTLTRVLKSAAETRGILVVALTAYAMKEDKERAKNAGCDGYISKPIDTRELPKIVASYLRRSETEGQVMKVLVVEDQRNELKLITHVLVAAGGEVGGIGTAEEAFEAIRKDRPDVILVDVALPGMDGFELIRLLKADPATRDLIAVAVTAYPEEYPKQEALEAGFDAYLAKPISTRTLPEELQDIVKSHKEGSV